jgi:hypothetical protein
MIILILINPYISGKLNGIDPFIGSDLRLNAATNLTDTSLVQAANKDASDNNEAALGSDIPMNVASNSTESCVVISNTETIQAAVTGFLVK